MNAARWQRLAEVYNQMQLDVQKLTGKMGKIPDAELIEHYWGCIRPLTVEAKLHPRLVRAAILLEQADLDIRADLAKEQTGTMPSMSAVLRYAQAADSFARIVHQLLLTDKPDGPTGWPA